MEESAINWLDLGERGVYDQHAWSWQKEASATNRHDLDEREASTTNKHGLDKRGVCDQHAWSWREGCLWPTGMILTCLWPTGMILTRGASVTNRHDLDEREHLRLLILETKLLPTKIKIWNQFLTDKGFAFPLLCDFHLPLLDLNFIKKSLIYKRFYFWERFDLWYLKFFEINFKTLKLWDSDLKFGN